MVVLNKRVVSRVSVFTLGWGGASAYMERHETVQVMLGAGKKYSISVKDLGALVPKLIVLSVKYVSRRALWSARFEAADFVDWPLVEGQQAKRNVLGGCAEWLGMLAFCGWESLGRNEGAEQMQPFQPLPMLRRHMRESSLDTGDKDGWTLVCKVFVLMLVQGLPGQHALENLTCGVFKRDTRLGCMTLLAKQVYAILFFIDSG